MAIAADFLLQNRLHSDTLGDQRFVVLTDSSGANRVYESDDLKFESLDGDVVVDSDGNKWTVTPDALNAVDGDKSLPRVPAHRAFWFGWYAQYPHTRLVQ